MWLRQGLKGFFFGGIFWASMASAETVVSTSNPTQNGIDSAIAALLAVESAGIDRLGKRQLARLSSIPKADTRKLTGYSKARLSVLPSVDGGKHWQCLAHALYFEARGESVLGQFAVAGVILNRVQSSSYPDSICGVVRQGTGRRHGCQFSFYCDGRAEIINEPEAFDQVGKIAKIMMDGAPRNLTNGATHYHTKAVDPSWSRVFPRTATIGYHHFYRQPVRIVRR